MKYRFAGIEMKLSLGVFPDVSIAEFRYKREEARKHLTNNIDLGILKNSIKRSTKEAAENSFDKSMKSMGSDSIDLKAPTISMD